jgi:predicted metalloprotease with PDZ domain
MVSRPILRLGAALLSLLALPANAPAQRADRGESEISAPISDVAYVVAFDSASARERRMRVRMEFRVAGDAPVVLSLPAWTPGAYELSFFSRWVTNFAVQGDGKGLRWEKADYDSWRIQPGSARTVRVTFDYVADTLDNAMSWSRADFLLFNGTNVFLYPEGRPLEFPSTVRVETQPGWSVATGMTAAGQPRTYTAASYHDLVDMPFFVGRFELDSAQIENRWVRFATYPVGSVSRSERASTWQQFRRMIPPQAAVFGEIPWQTYSILQIADSGYGGISC